MRMSALTISILCALFAGGLLAAPAAAPEKRVVLMVWDGMRPDFISEKETPTLWQLAQGGVTFRNHHAVYPSATNVNGTTLVTGMYPGHSGILANHEYRREIDSRHAFEVESGRIVQKGDELSHGKYVAYPTLPEIVRGAGRETVVATAKTVGLLQDRHHDKTRLKNSALLSSGQMLPREVLAPVVEQLGAFPSTFLEKDVWTTKALTEIFWKERVPAFSLLWLSEPDGAEHETAPGSETTRAALKACDDNLAAVLAALDRQGARSTTDVFVVSDHGFSTIERSIDLPGILREAGFDAVTDFKTEPKRGQVMLVGNGGTVLFYVIEHEEKVMRRLVDFLQQSDFAGVLFTPEKVEGTFPLEQAGWASNHAPDVAMAFRWNNKTNVGGVPGMIDADWQRRAGKGTHATLSHFDMHNTLVAAGPDFRHGHTDDLASGNVDLAPTVLHILGIRPPPGLDGRVLLEALADGDGSQPEMETYTTEAGRGFPNGRWKQTLKISKVGSTLYLDEGNGGFLPRSP